MPAYLLISCLVGSCSVLSEPTPTPQPPGLVSTIAAQTWSAFESANPVTPTSTISPFATPGPTETPTVTMTPTVTDTPVLQLTLQPSLTYPVPLRSPWPSVTPTQIACNVAQFVQDVTIPDGTRMSPNKRFVKIWRIMNTGTCSWGKHYTFDFASGERMKGIETGLPHRVDPGEMVDIAVSMVSPGQAGDHYGYWMLKVNDSLFGSGNKGDKGFSVKIIVTYKSSLP
ncbi:MAG: hypothetical protein JXB15_03980 [Anaerolineales bacterium]|nr:hypothetical protein [Anaerolineales bacterium]